MGKGRVVTRTAVPRDPASSRGANGANPGGAAPNRQAREGKGREGGECRGGAALCPKTRRAQALQTLAETHPCRGSAALRQKARHAQTFRDTAGVPGGAAVTRRRGAALR